MKIPLLVLPMLGVLAVGAQAQTSTAKVAAQPAKVSTEPAAVALLNKAIATYKNASGISYRVSTVINGKQGDISTIRFALPNSISVEQENGTKKRSFLQTGGDFYIIESGSYRKQPAMPISGPRVLGGTSAAASSFLAALLDGKNPVAESQKRYVTAEKMSSFVQAPFHGLQGRVAALGTRVIDGDILSGVQSTFSFKIMGRDGKVSPIREQTTAWFGGSPLVLRRVQYMLTQSGKNTTISERLFDQKISPTFEPDAFKFNDAGLKLVVEEEPQYFDPQLKVGAAPFTFSAKGLDGTPISLSNYKGKVVLMDFWATWCGPCVASLPELKGAYDKYHSQGLEVVGISLDEDKSALTSFIKTRKMAWPQIFDGKGWNSAVPGVYGVKAIPFMLIIGKDGKIAAVNPRGNIEAAVKAALAAS